MISSRLVARPVRNTRIAPRSSPPPGASRSSANESSGDQTGQVAPSRSSAHTVAGDAAVHARAEIVCSYIALSSCSIGCTTRYMYQMVHSSDAHGNHGFGDAGHGGGAPGPPAGGRG